MKVMSVEPAGGEYVTVDGVFHTEYRRYSPDAWECLMGMAWEPVFDCAELEAAYQAFKARKA